MRYLDSLTFPGSKRVDEIRRILAAGANSTLVTADDVAYYAFVTALKDATREITQTAIEIREQGAPQSEVDVLCDAGKKLLDLIEASFRREDAILMEQPRNK
jgi:hypothetical protein